MEVKNLEVENIWYEYYKLIYKICSKYQYINSLYTLDDLLSEAYIALNEVYSRYDNSKSSLSTFIFSCINRRICEIVNGHSSKDRGNLKLITSCLSLDVPFYEDKDGNSTNLADMIEDGSIPDDFDLPEKIFLYDLRKAEESALDELRPNQQEVVKSLNGFDSAIYSQSELGRIRGVSKERIRQIMNDAYRKLRQNDKLIAFWNEEYGTREYKKVFNKRIQNDWNY